MTKFSKKENQYQTESGECVTAHLLVYPELVVWIGDEEGEINISEPWTEQ